MKAFLSDAIAALLIAVFLVLFVAAPLFNINPLQILGVMP